MRLPGLRLGRLGLLAGDDEFGEEIRAGAVVEAVDEEGVGFIIDEIVFAESNWMRWSRGSNGPSMAELLEVGKWR